MKKIIIVGLMLTLCPFFGIGNTPVFAAPACQNLFSDQKTNKFTKVISGSQVIDTMTGKVVVDLKKDESARVEILQTHLTPNQDFVIAKYKRSIGHQEIFLINLSNGLRYKIHDTHDFEHHNSYANRIEVSADGRLLLLSPENIVFDITKKKLIFAVQKISGRLFNSEIYDIRLLDDGGILVVGKSSVYVMDTAHLLSWISGPRLRYVVWKDRVAAQKNNVKYHGDFEASTTGKYFAYVSLGMLQFYDTKTGQVWFEKSFSNEKFEPGTIGVFHRNGPRIVFSKSDDKFALWDRWSSKVELYSLVEKKLIKNFYLARYEETRSVYFSDDGKYLVSTGQLGAVQVFDISSGREVFQHRVVIDQYTNTYDYQNSQGRHAVEEIVNQTDEIKARLSPDNKNLIIRFMKQNHDHVIPTNLN